MRILLLSALILLTPLGAAPALGMDPDHKPGKEQRQEEKWERKAHRKAEKAARKSVWHGLHERDDQRKDHQDWDFGRPRHRHPAPNWMNNYWRPQERHYAALVPGDYTRAYFYVGNRWVLRSVRDPSFRLDLMGAWDLPSAQPPGPLPGLGIGLKIVLFD